jgi:hypothetical protein
VAGELCLVLSGDLRLGVSGDAERDELPLRMETHGDGERDGCGVRVDGPGTTLLAT